MEQSRINQALAVLVLLGVLGHDWEYLERLEDWQVELDIWANPN